MKPGRAELEAVDRAIEVVAQSEGVLSVVFAMDNGQPVCFRPLMSGPGDALTLREDIERVLHVWRASGGGECALLRDSDSSADTHALVLPARPGFVVVVQFQRRDQLPSVRLTARAVVGELRAGRHH
jgi:hypothetical protein